MNSYFYKQPIKTIVAPTKATIILPFKDAKSRTLLRAMEEKQTDFTNLKQANLCTLSFAASELKKYLQRVSATQIEFAEKGEEVEGFTIELSCGDAPKSNCNYTISPTETGVALYGNSRVGALYSAYTFLRMQGIRWYYPGNEGEYVPPKSDKWTIPTSECDYVPDMHDGRGLDIFAPLKDSENFLLWMARNRLNIAGDHDLTAALGDKLGMTFRIGGHMFEPFLAPDKPLADGRTIWESHPEWYGLPENGVREKSQALRNQFCVSCPDLTDYLADILIGKLRGEWHHVDRVDIWGFDCGFGTTCQCEKCKSLGNDTDQAIHFLSELRRRLNKTEVKNVALVACSYEGTKTMDAPSRPIPENLFERDCVITYPIHRCYAHDFDDPSCPTNSVYMKQIMPWLNQEKHLPMVMGEYYNVSKYEDLPLTFSKRIKNDLPLYKKMGFSSITYMHPPLYNWGVRALNHMLYAELSWDITADADKLEEEYYKNLYEDYYEDIKRAYALTESASEHIGSYRNWWFSVLEGFALWEGGVPDRKIDLTGHFANYDELLKRLDKDLSSRKECLQIVENVLKRAKREAVTCTIARRAANPEEARKFDVGNKIISRLLELRRSFIYGADELTLFSLLVKEYIDAERDEYDVERWAQIEDAYDKLAGYFYPQRYSSRQVESACDDALTRSQLRGAVNRRRVYLINTLKAKI